MNETMKQPINEKKALLLYFGNSEEPYGLAFENTITDKDIDEIIPVIKQRMLEVIQNK